MSKPRQRPARPTVTDEDLARAYDVKEAFSFEAAWTSDEESERYDALCVAANAVYSKLSLLKAYDDLYGEVAS